MELKKPIANEIVESLAVVLDRARPAGNASAPAHERLWESLPSRYAGPRLADGRGERWARAASLAIGGAGGNRALRGH